MLTYQEYKDEKDVFWSDVPHEKCQMVTKKNKVKRKYMITQRKQQSCVSPQQNIKTKWRKRKQRKLNVKKTTTEEIPSEFIPTEILHNREVNNDNQPSCPFHLFVKSRTSYKIEIENPLHMDVLQNLIKEHDKIPTEMQMITHHGKLLRHSSLKQLESGDTIHVIVRGKGGGKSKSSKNKKEPPNDTSVEESPQLTSEADVEKWLKLTVKLPEQHLKNDFLKQLDADTLMSYDDPQDLYEELHLPKGFARKVIYLKDNPSDSLIGGFTRGYLENVTIDDIVEFAKENLDKAKNIREIENAIRRECIDGFVMQLYEDHNALAKDLEMITFLARKFFIFVKKQIREKGSVSDTKIPASFSATTSSSSGEICSDEVFLSDMLGLRCLDGDDENQEQTCQLFGIHNQWTEGNKLGEMFLFWILSKDSLTKQEQNRLWKDITSNIPLWLDTLPDEEKNNFSQGKSENKYLYKGGPPVSIRNSGSVVHSFDKISTDLRDKFRNHILILHNDVSSVTTSPHILDRRTIIAEHGKKTFWVFDKDGLRMVQPSRENTSPADEHGKDEQTKVEQCEDGKNRDHQSNDHQSKQNAYRLEYYGETKQKYENRNSKTSSEANEMISEVPTSNVSFLHPRKFKQDSSPYVYYKDYLIDQPESGSGMISVSMEFKLFTTSIGSGNSRQKFLKETLRFACGCLNRRRNGTIYFGVGDNQGKQKGDKYKHGQIVGFPILESDEDSKCVYIDDLHKAKSSWFDSPEANAAATQCIRDPVFVKVSSPSSMSLYVMEVDVEPSSSLCEGVKFKLDLSHVEGKRQGVYVYVRDGANTNRLMTLADEENFMLKLKDCDKRRQFEEENTSSSITLVPESHKYLGEKLCRKLCRGERKFDLSFWPILMPNKPTEEMKTWIYKSMNFISHVPWKAVFEFDNESNVKGLCSNFFPSSQTVFTDGEVFRNNENVNELRNTLRIPEKNVVTFCNGRSDMNSDRLSKYAWKRNYLPNIKSAINFFQKTSVVPEGRAIIVCLLFSSDIEGYTETFGEIVTLFGFQQVVLICADSHIYNTFKSAILQQQIMEEQDLENLSIVGMPWDQTNECINKLMGVENPTVTFLPSSSGVFVEVDHFVEESLDTLEILSSKQCESRKFETSEEKEVFYREKELQFYQGHRVEWWNFFFENQVLERHCFHRLTTKIRDALKPRKMDIKRVSPIYLKHEPGAGGSTLSRHLLWHFRKEFRCAVITKLKEKTASDIVSLWQYKEETKLAQPLLLLIDSVPEQTLDCNELFHLISNRLWTLEDEFFSPICVLLICIREEPIKVLESSLSVMESDFLPQKVEESEKNWLSKKIEELEKSSLDRGLTKFKGEYFITFLILHSNFNKDFLLGTVTDLLKGMTFDSKSCKLLMYVALVVAFVSPSKGGPAIAVPIECCSEFMGQSLRIKQTKKYDDDLLMRTSLWENELTGPERILLVVEDKENGSGKQVRMAHPNLAKTVLDCAQVVFRESQYKPFTDVALANIALDFLESDILKTASYGKVFVIRLCIEMLTRRKKEEYDDDETTKFSPLVESIRSESETKDIAVRVLEKGFDVIQDGHIAQQLARLYLENKAYDLAKTWAEKAVVLSQKRSSVIHTLGHVCKLRFLSLKIWDLKKQNPNVKDITDGLDIGLEALDHFKDASTCDKSEINLFSCLDVLSTINCIARFVYELINFDEDRHKNDTIKRYLLDDDYIPEELRGWDKYHGALKRLYPYAIEAVDILDDHIYNSRCSYASRQGNSAIDEHRASRSVKRRLPDMYEDFAKFFGEETSEPPHYIQSGVLLDEWHRRAIVALGGRRLVDLFKIKDKENSKAKLAKVQVHLNNILSKNSDDYLNMVSVNLAMAQLKAAKQTDIKTLFRNCKEIVELGRKGNTLNMAYFYIMMFLWPVTDKQQVKYDHQLMIKSIRHLYHHFRDTKRQKRDLKNENDLFKRENNVFDSVVLFYAAKDKGLSSFCHRSKIFGTRRRPLNEDKDEFWEKRVIQESLKLFNGRTRLRSTSGTVVSVVVDLQEFGIDHEIEIRNLRCRRPENTEIPVSFFLGFSHSGPVVCYMRPKESLFGFTNPHLREVDYTAMSKSDLLELKRKIQNLKARHDLSEGEKSLIQDEEDIDEAIDEQETQEDLYD